jgi:hypothetical protein
MFELLSEGSGKGLPLASFCTSEADSPAPAHGVSRVVDWAWPFIWDTPGQQKALR